MYRAGCMRVRGGHTRGTGLQVLAEPWLPRGRRAQEVSGHNTFLSILVVPWPFSQLPPFRPSAAGQRAGREGHRGHVPGSLWPNGGVEGGALSDLQRDLLCAGAGLGEWHAELDYKVIRRTPKEGVIGASVRSDGRVCQGASEGRRCGP